MCNRVWAAAIAVAAGALVLVTPGPSQAQYYGALRNNYGNWTHFHGYAGFLDGGGFNVGYGGIYAVPNYRAYGQVYNVAPPAFGAFGAPPATAAYAPAYGVAPAGYGVAPGFGAYSAFYDEYFPDFRYFGGYYNATDFLATPVFNNRFAVAGFNPSSVTPFAFDNLTGNPAYGLNATVAPALPVVAPEEVKATTATFASVRVTVPANAELWFDNAQTKQVGPVREFKTPSLPTNRSFTYQVRVRWQEDGQMREQQRTVRVVAGQRLAVDFTNGEAAE
jgi:uncharacterized protein (TIGR03000 family)